MGNNIIPSDAPSIFDSLSTLQQQAIVTPNNPPAGIAGFIFDITGDEIVELESRITDHFVEDNTSIQDNIAIPPEKVTVKGIVGELVYSPPPQSSNPAAIADPLPFNGPMQPTFTPVQQQSQADNARANDLANENISAATSPYSYYGDNSINPQSGQKQTPLDAQSAAFGFFYQLWKGRMLFTVQTAFGIWLNMAILNVRWVQPQDTTQQSDVQVVFKKIRIAGAAVVNSGQLAGRNAIQSAPTTNNGIAGQNTPTDAQANTLFSTFQGTTQPTTP